MEIYIFLLCFVFCVSFICKHTIYDEKKKNLYILGSSMIMIFLILSLKKDTVGIDILSYKKAYEIAAYHDWFDFSYIYFEPGYIFITKIFSTLGVSFQGFMAIIYLFLCSTWYIFLKKNSKNVTMSLIIFICYDCFVFYTSAVRQTISTAVCLLAFLAITKSGKKNVLISIILVWYATSIHSSAFLFFPVLYIACMKNDEINIYTYITVLITSFLFKPYLLNIISNYFSRGLETEGMELGFSFILQLLFVLIMIYPIITAVKQNKKLNSLDNDIRDVRLNLFNIALYLLLSGTILLRGTMYTRVFLAIALPNLLGKYRKNDRLIISVGCYSILIILFFVSALLPSQLNICPYKFFWQT